MPLPVGDDHPAQRQKSPGPLTKPFLTTILGSDLIRASKPACRADKLPLDSPKGLHKWIKALPLRQTGAKSSRSQWGALAPPSSRHGVRESERSSSNRQVGRSRPEIGAMSIHSLESGCTIRNPLRFVSGLCIRLMVFLVAPNAKTRQNLGIGDERSPTVQPLDIAAILGQSILPFLKSCVTLLEGRPSSSMPTATPVAGPIIAADQIHSELAAIRAEVAEIKTLLTVERGEVVKEAYTVAEVAGKTKLTPWTIRQACNKQRVKGAYKGRDRGWRIPHAALVEIIKDGLPPE